MLTDEQWEKLRNVPGLAHSLGSLACWCKPTVITEPGFHVLTHHYSAEALFALRNAFPDQGGFGVVRIPTQMVHNALQVAQYVARLADNDAPITH